MIQSNLIIFIIAGIVVFLFAIFLATRKGNPIVLFDLSHGQFQDIFVNQSYYDYVLPSYKEICKEMWEGAKNYANELGQRALGTAVLTTVNAWEKIKRWF